jgi:branched-subunit amino acid transport protein
MDALFKRGEEIPVGPGDENFWSKGWSVFTLHEPEATTSEIQSLGNGLYCVAKVSLKPRAEVAVARLKHVLHFRGLPKLFALCIDYVLLEAGQVSHQASLTSLAYVCLIGVVVVASLVVSRRLYTILLSPFIARVICICFCSVDVRYHEPVEVDVVWEMKWRDSLGSEEDTAELLRKVAQLGGQTMALAVLAMGENAIMSFSRLSAGTAWYDRANWTVSRIVWGSRLILCSYFAVCRPVQGLMVSQPVRDIRPRIRGAG